MAACCSQATRQLHLVAGRALDKLPSVTREMFRQQFASPMHPVDDTRREF